MTAVRPLLLCLALLGVVACDDSPTDLPDVPLDLELTSPPASIQSGEVNSVTIRVSNPGTRRSDASTLTYCLGPTTEPCTATTTVDVPSIAGGAHVELTVPLVVTPEEAGLLGFQTHIHVCTEDGCAVPTALTVRPNLPELCSIPVVAVNDTIDLSGDAYDCTIDGFDYYVLAMPVEFAWLYHARLYQDGARSAGQVFVQDAGGNAIVVTTLATNTGQFAANAAGTLYIATHRLNADEIALVVPCAEPWACDWGPGAVLDIASATPLWSAHHVYDPVTEARVVAPGDSIPIQLVIRNVGQSMSNPDQVFAYLPGTVEGMRILALPHIDVGETRTFTVFFTAPEPDPAEPDALLGLGARFDVQQQGTQFGPGCMPVGCEPDSTNTLGTQFRVEEAP